MHSKDTLKFPADVEPKNPMKTTIMEMMKLKRNQILYEDLFVYKMLFMRSKFRII